jgi:cytochrome c biogenesis protein CcmG/thiol:disulfide interchange protein DsbE
MARALRPLAWTLTALGLVAVLAIFGLASSGSSTAARMAPALPSEQLSGPAPLPLSGGRSKLVVFWASWCEPCVREAPALERFARSAAGRGRLVGVDWSDGLSGARSFIRRYAWTFTNLRDGGGTVGNDYRVGGLPTTFAIDGRGRIRATLRGPQDEASLTRALATASRG